MITLNIMGFWDLHLLKMHAIPEINCIWIKYASAENIQYSIQLLLNKLLKMPINKIIILLYSSNITTQFNFLVHSNDDTTKNGS